MIHTEITITCDRCGTQICRIAGGYISYPWKDGRARMVCYRIAGDANQPRCPLLNLCADCESSLTIPINPSDVEFIEWTRANGIHFDEMEEATRELPKDSDTQKERISRGT